MAAKDYLYTESHEWVEAAGDVRRVGITDHAQQMMGDIVFADLPKPGKTLNKGDEILVIESPKAAASVYAPISGEIVAVNDALSAEPGKINADPFGDGWIVKIRPTNEASERSSLKSHDDYRKLVEG